MTMAERGWTGRVLFLLGCSLAGCLVLLLIVAPLLDNGDESSSDLQTRIIAVFARDPVLRRTCLASAVGLVVSACIFFRPMRRTTIEAAPPPSRPRSSGMAGA